MSVENKLERLQEDLNDVTSYLNDFLAFLPSPFCTVTPSAVIGNLNKAFERFSGFNLSEALGERLDSFFEAKKDIADLLKDAEDRYFIRNREAVFITKKGERIPVSLSCGAKRNERGELMGFFLTMTDISELKKLQKETEKKIKERTKDLKESRRALLNILEDTELARRRSETERNKAETIFRNFVDGLLILNQQQNFELINPAAENYLNVKEKDYLGKKLSSLKERKDLRKFLKIISSDKEIFRQEFAIPEKELTLEASTRFVYLNKEQLVTLIIVHDITREKMVERLKSQFVSVAAHQLRTPLSIIKWSLSMLLEGDVGLLTNAQKDMVTKASETNERMIRLINDLLNVARIEEGRFVYHPKTVDLIELLEDVAEPAKTMAYSKGIKFEFKKPKDDKSKIVKVDIEKISLAVKNLLDNAIHYTEPKGKVTLIAERKKDRVFVSVKDSGIGIPKDQQDRVFSKFFRADNAVRTDTEGTGLGLFITKNIIEAHKGEISFTSQEGKGTMFTFSLPVIG